MTYGRTNAATAVPSLFAHQTINTSDQERSHISSLIVCSEQLLPFKFLHVGTPTVV